MKKMKKVVFGLLIFLSATYLVFIPTTTYAQTPEAWSGDCIVKVTPAPSGPEFEVATIQGFECLFKNIVRILTPIAGLAVFITFIAGAFQMITAGGEAKQIQKARKTLTAAVLGLVVFVGIWFILLLIKAITGVDVTKFEIPGP